MEKFCRKFGLLITLLLANTIFFILYLRFFRGNAVYLYTDIGSDSVTSSLPIISMLQRMFETGNFSGYSLNAGLGSDLTSILVKYLNPIKFPLLFFSGDRLPLGLMLSMLIQTNVTAFFSWIFFKNLFRHGTGALFSSLAWTFSGYITLWSQNLTIGSCMAMFTVVMAAALFALRKPSVRHNLLLSLSLALFLITNYYYTYMTGFYCLFFLIFLCILEENSITEFFIKGLELLGAAVFAIGLAAIGIVPSITGFASSVRTSSVGSGLKHLVTLSVRGIICMLGRLFSVNTFGVGDHFTGLMNYYECAALSTTVLVIFSVVYLLTRKQTRAAVIAALLLSCASLYIKNTGAILQFNSGVQRYSFMICFTAAASVGLFIKMIMTDPDRKALLFSSGLSLSFTAGFFIFLWKKGSSYGFTVNTHTLKLAACAVFAFSVLLVLLALSGKRMRVFMTYVMLFVLSAELIVMNSETLYSRTYVTKENYTDLAAGFGIKEAVSAIQEYDDGLYRISASSDSDDANAGMLLDFPASSTYSNTNSAALGTLEQAFGTSQLSQNHFLADDSNFGIFTLLAGKYLIKDNSSASADTPSAALYQKIGETSDGRKAIYENISALPFGYLYTKQMSSAEAEELSLPERIAALGQACFRTNGISSIDDENADEASAERVFDETELSSLFSINDILTSGRDANCLKLRKTSTGIIFMPDGGDPYLFYDIGPAEEGTVRLLYMKLGSTAYNGTRQMEIFFMSEGDENPDAGDSRIFTISDGFDETCIVIPDDVTTIRLDFPQDSTNTDVTELSILTLNSAQELFSNLGTDVTDIKMENGTYTAVLHSDEGGIFCVPLLYSSSWTASVNGERVPVQNINGGLIGIAVDSGTTEIRLEYRTPVNKIAAGISLLLLVFSVVLFILSPDRKKRK